MSPSNRRRAFPLLLLLLAAASTALASPVAASPLQQGEQAPRTVTVPDRRGTVVRLFRAGEPTMEVSVRPGTLRMEVRGDSVAVETGLTTVAGGDVLLTFRQGDDEFATLRGDRAEIETGGGRPLGLFNVRVDDAQRAAGGIGASFHVNQDADVAGIVVNAAKNGSNLPPLLSLLDAPVRLKANEIYRLSLPRSDARLRKLPPGAYTLQITARSPDGGMTVTCRRPFRIAPPYRR